MEMKFVQHTQGISPTKVRCYFHNYGKGVSQDLATKDSSLCHPVLQCACDAVKLGFGISHDIIERRRDW